MLMLHLVGFRSKVNAPVMQDFRTESACLRLLTVKEVAAQLRTSTATVYALCERGRLAYVRVSTHAIRIADADLSLFIHGRRAGET